MDAHAHAAAIDAAPCLDAGCRLPLAAWSAAPGKAFPGTAEMAPMAAPDGMTDFMMSPE